MYGMLLGAHNTLTDIICKLYYLLRKALGMHIQAGIECKWKIHLFRYKCQVGNRGIRNGLDCAGIYLEDSFRSRLTNHVIYCLLKRRHFFCLLDNVYKMWIQPYLDTCRTGMSNKTQNSSWTYTGLSNNLCTPKLLLCWRIFLPSTLYMSDLPLHCSTLFQAYKECILSFPSCSGNIQVHNLSIVREDCRYNA